MPRAAWLMNKAELWYKSGWASEMKSVGGICDGATGGASDQMDAWAGGILRADSDVTHWRNFVMHAAGVDGADLVVSV